MDDSGLIAFGSSDYRPTNKGSYIPVTLQFEKVEYIYC